MKRTYRLKNLDCANCAAKIENKIKKIKGVTNCLVNFMSTKLVIEYDEELEESILIALEKQVHKVDKQIEIISI